MRNLVNVINEMVENIPESEIDLIKELERIKSDQIQWTAPESMVRWEEVSYALQDYLYNPKPTKEWQFKILSIWSTKSIEEVKEYEKYN